jgi:hypothetical protein
MSTMSIGSVEVQRVLERVGPIKGVGELFPATPDDAWTSDLAQHHWTPSTGAHHGATQTWVQRPSTPPSSEVRVKLGNCQQNRGGRCRRSSFASPAWLRSWQHSMRSDQAEAVAHGFALKGRVSYE